MRKNIKKLIKCLAFYDYNINFAENYKIPKKVYIALNFFWSGRNLIAKLGYEIIVMSCIFK